MNEPEIPSYLEMMLPTLKALEEIGTPVHYTEVDERASAIAELTPEQLAVEYPEGMSQSGPKVLHRIAWSRTLLKRVGAANNPAWGKWTITDLGREILSQPDDEASARLHSLYSASLDTTEPDEEFFGAARSQAEAGSPQSLTVRQLIGLWGAARRGSTVNARIAESLSAHGLTTEPDFATTGVDFPVSLVLEQAEWELEWEPPPDVILKVGPLPSATGGVVSIQKEDTLKKAIALMMAHDFSQLPVVSGPRRVLGAVTWESIAKARLKNPDPKLSDCIEPSQVVSLDAPILEVARQVVDHEFVVVTASDDSIMGIVTMADLSEQYLELANPFLLIGEIERWLRIAINRTLSSDEITEYLDPDREISGAEDLTLGEHQTLFGNKELWQRFGWDVDRGVFNEQLNEARLTRNEVMHFSPDPLDTKQVQQLRSFLGWIRFLAG